MRFHPCVFAGLDGLAVLAFLLLAGPAAVAADGRWTALGPEGGSAVDLAVGADGVVWACTSRGSGLFRSADGGASWSRSRGTERFPVQAVAVDPSRPEILYTSSVTGAGILRSTDGGSSWVAVNRGLPATSGGAYTGASSLQVHPRDPRMVFAATESGLYVSRNRGGAWEQLFPYFFRVFAVAPSDPRFLYASRIDGPARSTDGGLTWTPMDLGFDGIEVSALAVHPTSPEIVWAGRIPRDEGRPVLYRSTDGGVSWSSTGLRRTVRSLLIDPDAPDTLWAGTDGGVVRVFDQGARWRFFPVSAGEGVLSLALDPTDPRVLYAGTGWSEQRSSQGYPGRQGGVWRSEDRGRTWRQGIRGMIATEVQAVTAPAPGRIVASVLGRGPMILEKGRSDWMPGDQGIERDIRDLLADPADPETLWAATTNGVFRSEDGGRTWVSASEGLTGYSGLLWRVFDELAIDPRVPGGLWTAGWGGLFHSDDGGRSWTRVEAFPEDFSFSSVAVDPTDPRRVWAVSLTIARAPAVFQSDDGGVTWRETRFASPLDSVAVGPSGTVFVSALSQLLRSTDHGATWQAATLSGAISIAPHPTDPERVCAGGYLGLSCSRDGGATWQAVRGDTWSSMVLDVTWESPRRLLVATRGDGLQRFVPAD